jgi:mRNA interferase MazF
MGKNRFVTPGEIYMCDLDEVLGSEQGGNRPVVVVSNSKICAFSPTVQVVPVTSKAKGDLPTHYSLYKKDYPAFNYNVNLALCEQVRTIDKTRLGQKLCSLSHYDFYNIVQATYKNFPF